MAKGSQLTQLKSEISHSGLFTQPQNPKKRKRAVAEEKIKEKRASKLLEIHEKLNPFDVKVTKLKHNVGGRKLKGISGRPAQSKQAGLEQVSDKVLSCVQFLTSVTIAQKNAPERISGEGSRWRCCRQTVWRKRSYRGAGGAYA